ncbi:MAG: DUF1365 domain-containing protein [Thermoleophilaceae bacterium]|nr:DUF1365 domain-containing protein [Thermoleophilaceae bacterium]
MTASAVYDGWVRHRRHTPVEHEFTYRHAMVLLDLGELPEVLDSHPFYSATGRAPVRFRREDYMGDPERPLDECVRDLVEERTGARPRGAVRLLTTLRTFGHSFNPVSFYYCFTPGSERVEAVVAQVTNTPWGETHSYVLGRSDEHAVMKDTMDKVFHVSPFIGMDNRYEWRVTEPNGKLLVHIDERDPEGNGVFDATLSLDRHELTRGRLTRMLLRFPATSLRVVFLIYWNALRLKLKGAPYHPHPKTDIPEATR